MSLSFVLSVAAVEVFVALAVGTAVRMRLEGVGWRRLWLVPLVAVLLFVAWPVSLLLRARFRAAARVVRLYPQLVGVAARRALAREGNSGEALKLLFGCRAAVEKWLGTAGEPEPSWADPMRKPPAERSWKHAEKH